jgi:hypothetical protein
MKRNLQLFAFLSLLAMPLCSYGVGPINQTGSPLEAVKQRISQWLNVRGNYALGPWHEELIKYDTRYSTEGVIHYSTLQKAEGYPYAWICLGGRVDFLSLKKMTIKEVRDKFGEGSIFLDLKTTYACYVKPHGRFFEPSVETLKGAYEEAIIRRLGDQIDKYVEEQVK